MPQPTQGNNNRITTVSEFVNRVATAGRAAFDVFNGRPFSPGQPFAPSTSKQEQQGGPRAFNYRSAQNMVYQPRHEYNDLTPFDELRNFSRLYPVSAICVKKIVEGITRLDWSIKCKDKKKQAAYQEAGVIDEITNFFEKPSELDFFDTWLKKLLRDVLELDALCLYPSRAHNGKLLSLEVIDGSTVKPIIDDRGRVLAYQQIIYGVPGSNYIRYGLDRLDEILPMNFPGLDGSELPQELIYQPLNVRSDNPYGIAPVELVIMAVNMALRKQSFDLSYFTDGNIPEMLLSPALAEGETMNVDQVEDFENYFNAILAGNDSARRRAKFLAWKADPTILKPFVYDTVLDQWMLKLTCAAYGVTPSEIGFTDDVNRATSEGQENVQFRGGIKPIAQWLAKIFKQIIVLEFGYTDLRFVWEFNENEDALAQAQVDQIYLQNKVLSPDEVRMMRFSGEVTGPAPVQPAPVLPSLPLPQGTLNPGQQNQQQSQEPPKLPQPDQGRQVAAQAAQPVAKWKVTKSQGPQSSKETGVMVAFMLNSAQAQLLALDLSGAEEPEDLHVTLAYLGDIDTLEGAQGAVLNAVSAIAQQFGPISGQVNGYGVFNGDHDSSARPLYANFDAPVLPGFREKLIQSLGSYGVEFANNHGYSPHITLAYLNKSQPLPEITVPALNLSFESIWVCWGDQKISVPFSPVQLVAAKAKVVTS